MTIHEVLSNIQKELVAPKAQYNSFGKYKYRNIEDLTEAIKPLLASNNASLVMSDDVVAVHDRVYIKATVSLLFAGGAINATGWAREAETKKGMDESQITGSASSYARKYAFCGLFCIDGEKDADSRDNSDKPEGKTEPINETQENTIAAIIGDNGIDKDKFLAWLKVKSISEISTADYDKAINALNAKIKAGGK